MSGRNDDGLLVAAKGAPEAIAGLCRASAEELAAVKASVDAMAAEGLRVLGVARARVGDGELPEDPHGFAFEYLGLVGSGRSAARQRARCGGRVPFGRHPRRDDHRRLSGDGPSDRQTGGAGVSADHDRRGIGALCRCGAGAARQGGDGLRPHHARTEAPHRQCVQGRTARSSP